MVALSQADNGPVLHFASPLGSPLFLKIILSLQCFSLCCMILNAKICRRDPERDEAHHSS